MFNGSTTSYCNLIIILSRYLFVVVTVCSLSVDFGNSGYRLREANFISRRSAKNYFLGKKSCLKLPYCAKQYVDLLDRFKLQIGNQNENMKKFSFSNFLSAVCWQKLREYWCFLFYQKMCTLFQKIRFRVCFLKMFRPLKGQYVLF